MAAVLLALAASASWGVSDFLGGLKTRSLNVLTVLAVSQPAGLILIAVVVAGRWVFPGGGWWLLCRGTTGQQRGYRQRDE